MSTYEPGRSGVSRSVRFHPRPRSTAMVPPVARAADIAPNNPMLIMMYAALLASSRLLPPMISTSRAGISMLKISTRLLRTKRTISKRRYVAFTWHSPQWSRR